MIGADRRVGTGVLGPTTAAGDGGARARRRQGRSAEGEGGGAGDGRRGSLLVGSLARRSLSGAGGGPAAVRREGGGWERSPLLLFGEGEGGRGFGETPSI
ncbi:unnamed protein product [Linum trigynum]|uniref:Uncharacterized protein n=1 Tax=Linum trigynum TaxID=586398 RepID=A0AAV2CIJ6_9ROSI